MTPHIVILTGAGASAPSGIPTFRGTGGFWNDHNVMELATPEGFEANPTLVHQFYSARRTSLSNVDPNAIHFAIAKLQREFDGTVTLVTQNVDDLHERGGSPNVIHMHGELKSGLCTACGARSPWAEAMDTDSSCPNCKTTGQMRPNVVWFGECPIRWTA